MSLCLTFVTLENININLNDTNYRKNVTTNDTICFEITNNLSTNYNYLEIKVEETSKDKKINHIISFYEKDSKFIDRKQFSKDFGGKTIMWLTKQQTQEKFYFKVECIQKPCNYKFHLNSFDAIDLPLGEQYTYYVTKETQNMIFNISSQKNLKNIHEYTFHLWAKGNKNINSSLKGVEPTKTLKDFNAYVIKVNDNTHFNYSFEVKGNIGDLINVGTIFTNEKKYYPITMKDDEEYEISGIINNNSNSSLESFNNLCFDVKNNNISIREVNYYDLSYENQIETYHKEKTVECLKMKIFGETFFSIHFKKNIKKEEKNIKIIPRTTGIYHKIYIEQGETIGIIPKTSENDFKFITFNLIKYFDLNEIKVSMYNCRTYPECKINKNTTSNSTKIESFNNIYHYSFTKDEWGNINPMSKNQNILLITCKKGINGIISNNQKSLCLSYLSIFNDKEKLQIVPQIHNYNFIRKGDNHNIILKEFKEVKDSFLFIEIYSGDVTINYNKEIIKFFEYGNKKFCKLTYNETKNFEDISINAKENSLYCITYSNSISQMINGNNLFNLDSLPEKMFGFKDNFNSQIKGQPKYNLPFYVRIYPINDSLQFLYCAQKKDKSKNIPYNYTHINGKRKGYYSEIFNKDIRTYSKNNEYYYLVNISQNKNDIKNETKNNTKIDNKNTTKNETKNNTNIDNKNITKNITKNETKIDNKNKTKIDIKNDTKIDIKNTTKNETKNNTKNETKNNTKIDNRYYFQASFHILDNKTTDIFDGIALSQNQDQLFMLDNKYKYKFIYPISEINSDVNIKFDSKENGTYKINIKINNEKYNVSYDNEALSNRDIKINSTEIKNKCKDPKQVCKLKFEIESHNDKETFLSIKVNNGKIVEKEGDLFSKVNEGIKNHLIWIMIGGGALVLLIIIIMIICILTAKKYSGLKEDLNKTSFVEEGLVDNEDDEDLI